MEKEKIMIAASQTLCKGLTLDIIGLFVRTWQVRSLHPLYAPVSYSVVEQARTRRSRRLSPTSSAWH